MDAPAVTDRPLASDHPTATDHPTTTDASVETDAPVSADVGTAPPAQDGGCDVAGVAGTRSRSPFAASLGLFALALASRRRHATSGDAMP